MNRTTVAQQAKTSSLLLPTQSILQRKCACGNHMPMGGECEKCKKYRFDLQQKEFVMSEAPEVPPIIYGVLHSPAQLAKNDTQVPAFASNITITPQSINFDEDPVHQPLIENYRRATGQPPKGIDEFGQRVGPTDAELKYSGVLGRVGSEARWLTPVINRRNAAEVYFNSTPLIDPPGGLTTQFINEQEIHDNFAVENAIPRPAVQTRNESSRAFCWFSRGVNATGRTTMDIFTPGPWDFPVTGAQAASRFASPSCMARSSPTVVHVNGDPNDRALDEYLRFGELEHEMDSERAFMNTISVYARNVNNLVGDTPRTRMSGSNPVDCNAKLRRLENRELLTDFALQLNAATARRHVGSRHSSSITGLRITRNCSDVTATMDAGTL